MPNDPAAPSPAEENDARAAALLHLRGETLSKGDPLALPLILSSVYDLPGDPDGFPTYGRSTNPTWTALEKALGHLEDAPTLAFPSGMAAITAAFMAVLRAGDRVLLPSDGYYTTRLLADQVLARFGIIVETRATAELATGGFDGIAMVFIETPSNPGLDTVDLAAIAREVRAAGGRSVADNTTMTPFGQRPLDLGVDIVVAADTKAPGGHSDVLMGHAATRDPGLLSAMRDWRTWSGSIPGPFEAWLTHRGLETLELRFDRMCRSAEALAPRLAAHPAVRGVRHPSLPDDPSHVLARQQMARFGFLIGLTVADDATAERFIAACPLLRPVTSFGGVHSAAERRARWGDDVAPGFVRISVGCEPQERLWEALDSALTHILLKDV